MSFFPRALVSDPNTSFTPLFRLLDDFDQYSRNTDGGNHHHRSGNHMMKTFSPKFDVKEVADAYELHGELPGIEQKDVEIEFTDAQTLTVRGRTERSYNSTNGGSIEGLSSAGAITDGSETNAHKPRHATVEDEKSAAKEEKTSIQQVALTKQNTKEAPEAKYWVSERSVGEFSRSFSFPVRVDQDQVKASMKNGVLSIMVPKSKKHESRKITIS